MKGYIKCLLILTFVSCTNDISKNLSVSGSIKGLRKGKLYLQKFIKNIKVAEKSGRWKIVGIDPDGFDLRKKKLLTRLYFDREITDSKKLRGMFVKLHKEALKN